MRGMHPERWDRNTESYDAFAARVNPARIVDALPELVHDLMEVRTPRLKFEKPTPAETDAFMRAYTGGDRYFGEWFYFPWNGTLARYLPEEDHLELRSARNRDIITREEQQKLYGLTVAYAGLSVGSHGVLTFAHLGGNKRIRIADPDTVSPSNLNRMRYDFLAVGRKKTDMVREHLYQLNPYADIAAFDEGVTPETMDAFLDGADVLVEETDNLEMKIRLRLAAREKGIPVVMATDNAHNVIVEVERYDLDRSTPLFNGAAGDITLDEFRSFPPQELPRLATKIAGPQLIAERMMLSLPQVGKTLYSWPQPATAATLAGVAIAYLLSRIALGLPVPTEKRAVSLDAALDPTYDAPEEQSRRAAIRSRFLSALGLT